MAIRRIAILFCFTWFAFLCVPVTPQFWQELFALNWSEPGYSNLFRLAHYTPRIYPGPDTFLNWAAVAVIAFVIGIAWVLIGREKTGQAELLYYGVRALARYRLAVAIFAYGFLMYHPLLAPYPSLSNLNTAYGDFTRWKLFSLSLGIVPGYQSFLGLVQVICGLLLLYRKTASIGAFIISIYLGNVFMSNLAYEGGETVYSLYLIILSLFVLSYDARRLIDLLILQRPANPNTYQPEFPSHWLRAGRVVLKASFVLVFVLFYALSTREAFAADRYQFPAASGLSGVHGIYNVIEFERNGTAVPYDSVWTGRWRDVVFEKWPTVSIRSSRNVAIDSNNTEHFESDDRLRTYELEGSAGRHYYSYIVDPAKHILTLSNKNPHYKGETLQFVYSQPDESTLILSGNDFNNDNLKVVLKLRNKKYLIEEAKRTGRRGAIRL
ncbi:DoxX family protein [Flavihumibacter solisilvae]|nr:DoxX family protein [Flavihumibacter solisilvae]